MKQYSVPIGIIGGSADRYGVIPLSPNKSLVFTFPIISYTSYRLAEIYIYVKFLDFSILVSVHYMGHVAVKILRMTVDTDVPTTQRTFEHHDENTVIRMNLTTPGTLNLFANEQLVSSTGIANSLVESAWVSGFSYRDGTPPVAEVTLSVFDKADSSAESAAGFAEGMRNPLDPQGARQRQIKREVDAAVVARESAIQAREDAVALREAAAANSTGGSGTGTNTGSPPTISPPDANAVDQSANFAWRFAVRQILRSTPALAASVQTTHNALMASWVTDRGDNIASTAYDYQVYSTGIAWPKAVLEATDEARLADVQKERGRVLRALLNYPSYGV